MKLIVPWTDRKYWLQKFLDCITASSPYDCGFPMALFQKFSCGSHKASTMLDTDKFTLRIKCYNGWYLERHPHLF
jgi:hypothetical protein